jgi:hypothetical protein
MKANPMLCLGDFLPGEIDRESGIKIPKTQEKANWARKPKIKSQVNIFWGTLIQVILIFSLPFVKGFGL